MILDQTTIRGIETLLIGLVFEGRVLPMAFSCLMKKWIHKSQNILEHSSILAAISCSPVEFRPLLILDRGYARVSLLIHLREEGIPFLVPSQAQCHGLPQRPGAKPWAVLRSSQGNCFVTRCCITPGKKNLLI